MFRGLKNYSKVYKLLWRSYGKNIYVRISFILRLISQIAKLVIMPVALAQIITRLADGNYDGAVIAVWWFVGGSFTIGVISPLVRFISTKGEQPTYTMLTKEYFSKLITTDIEYFNSNMSGYLTTATRQFLDGTIKLVRAWRQQYLITIFGIFFPIIVIFFFNWILGIGVLVLGTVQTIWILWSSGRLDKMRTYTRELYKKHSGVFSDAISNVVAVRASGRERAIIKQVENHALIEAKAFSRRYNFQSLFAAGREMISVSFFLVLMLMVVGLAKAGQIDLTTAVLVATYANTILMAIYTLEENTYEHDDLVDQIVPAFEILNRENKIVDPKKPIKFDHVQGAIELKDVDFTYRDEVGGGTEVFRGLSLKIPRGQKLGVVGLSGAGKSTLAKLILRFNDVAAGSVKIDDIDVRDVRQTDLHAQIAYVPQEPLLLHRSIRDNVILAKPEATEEEIMKVLRRAHATEFVDKLTRGMDSIVGERGVKLSGGQKQRVAIARALLQDAPVMILDEATSALDSESEQIIKDSFKDILRGKTAMVVAHRLSTLSDMDRIIVIDDGQIIEDGTHDELLKNGKLYAKLWRKQQRGIDIQ
ncbi:ABC transporter ATP-binding protein/permease [Candidatus Saccharibacteria bacterium]|nr:ABC transporter ATP-binding protein/permease [Candidatus Saccharibacteria bacterium]